MKRGDEMKRNARSSQAKKAKTGATATSTSSSSYGQVDYWEKRMQDDDNITWYFDYETLKPLLG